MKHIRILVLAAALALALPVAAWAESLSGADTWNVTYTASGEMSETYPDSWADEIGQLQPGDDITLNVSIAHKNGTQADWYLSNEVLKSLEEADAKGSAYAYRLSYNGNDLYNSQKVGGTDSDQGLAEATDALDEWVYLDTLSNGDTGKVTLNVSLDGETEGNAYFNTIAQLKLAFAVQPVVPDKETVTKTKTTTVVKHRTTPRTVVQTGDDTNLMPFYVAMAVSGLLLVVLGAYGAMQRKREREEA